MNADGSGGKSRNPNHKPVAEKQSSFIHWIGCRRFYCHLPETRIDQLFKLKSQIADWNSRTSSIKELWSLQKSVIGGN